ncbi:MAG TPA: TAT-variant-translocated molybdopterin oxidoreductase [Chthoniobacterales bacterium]|nr:TAT-variant-translocated molybdopterin oxidoreductase [Chthoniobacterales bacterium]
MKRVFEHPPEPVTGKRYWRSVNELSETPEFREWLEREFPNGASELDEEWSRRSFLKLMGASMALAGVGLTSCRRPEAYLVPFTKSVEWTIPGKALYYATAMPRRGGAIPLIATTVDGRPIKLEGNPLHPASGGATDVYAQASILDLYDPTRSRRFAQRAKSTTKGRKTEQLETRQRADFEKYLAELMGKAKADGGAGLAFLVEEVNSPTRDRLRSELERVFPSMRWCVYDPARTEAQNVAAEAAFGPNSWLVPQFERADVILALDADFVDCGDGDLAAARGFTARRRVSQAKDAMNRLYVVENRFTLTGSMADHRLRCPASQIPRVAYALAREIATATGDGSLNGLLGVLPPTPNDSLDGEWIKQAAADLASKAGSSLVIAGSHQPVPVQLLVHGMNAALKNLGSTLLVRDVPRNPRTISLPQLANEMLNDRVKQLFILGGDPVYNAFRGLARDPQTKQPLDWLDLQKRVPDVVRLGYHEDATSVASSWHLPMAHYLESWGDALARDGTYLSIQPMILPLFGGLSEIELINMVLGNPPVDGPQLIQDTFRATRPPGDFATAWQKFVHDGFAGHVQVRDHAATAVGGAAAGRAQQTWVSLPAPTAKSPEIVFVRDYSVDDGRYYNNGWLQELPDPVTKLAWDNAALISPNTADELDVRTGDLLRIAVTETARDQNNSPVTRELVIAAMIAPGHADHSVTIPLGYGRMMPGFDSLPYAGGNIDRQKPGLEEQRGFNGYLLRTVWNPHFLVADGKNIENVQVEKAGGTYPLAVTQEHWSIEGRGLVREATLDHYREENDFVKKIAGDEELPPKLPSLYAHPAMKAEQQWGMAVDLNVCTGCSACVIACQAENNTPVVGKLQVAHGRSMHWLRIDRYFASEKGFDQDRGEYPENPEMVHEPMMCQHCENAPCETVCPVNATIHSEDGLNVMAYNRCVGTRYCANNCPFKVRRFNFFDYNQRPVGKKKIAGKLGTYHEYLGPLTEKGAPDIIKLQKNPNVTVRMRGVMEKCTYCVQRIEEAKIAQHVRVGASGGDLRIPRDSFTSACAQACPNEAIVFGDIADPESKVSKIKAQDRNYRLLQYLNVNTRTSYLARIRNPNPKMPDAHLIGVASPVEKHHTKTEGHDYEDQHNKGKLKPTPDREPKGEENPAH